jgi:hypothetical protein
MARQNRVQPDGAILAIPARGALMGNRGILHDDAGQLTPARWRHKAWVTCVLAFKGRHRALMQPRHYTELFFHDEAVAFAAGHRPCAECRRADYTAFRDAAGISGPITGFDHTLHDARAMPRGYGQRRHRDDVAALPDGTFILGADGIARLVRGDALYPFVAQGYGGAEPRPAGGSVTVLTPGPLIGALRGGYVLTIRLPE